MIASRFDIERWNLSPWDETLRQIDSIYAEFESLGIPTVPSSRINAYRHAFQTLWDRAQAKEFLDLSLAVRVLNTLVEFHQLKTILGATKTSKNPDAWQDRLRTLVSGAEFSTGESNAASARDLQFESFVGAVCELSGYSVEFGEPDLVLSDDSQVFVIAAKRPRNYARCEKNFKKGVRQINGSGKPGMVAVDLSFALQADQCINTNDLRGGQVFVEEVANNFARMHQARLRNLSKGGNILGALLHVQMPVINYGHPTGPQLGIATRWTIVPLTDDENYGFLWVSEFCRKTEVGLLGSPEVAKPLAKPQRKGSR